jgi:AraC-like DNA-binding protein
MVIRRHLPIDLIEVNWLLRQFDRRGIGAERISCQLGCKLESTDGGRVFLPLADYLRLLEWGALELDDQHLGMCFAKEVDGGEMGVYGHVARNASDIRSVIRSLEYYAPIFMSGILFRVYESKCCAVIESAVPGFGGEGVRHDAEFTIVSFVNSIRALIDSKWMPEKVTFKHSCVGSIDIYHDTLGQAVSFDSPKNSIQLKVSDLDIPLNNIDVDLFAILTTYADKELEEWSGNNSFVTEIKSMISGMIESGGVSVDKLVDQLHITPRTLNRRLREDGVSYQQLRDEVIMDYACKALTQSNSCVFEIAMKLGYSESSSFVRAFKRKTGSTPNQYRQFLS